MIIGKFTKLDNGYEGAIATVMLNMAVTFEAQVKKTEKSPDYRVFSNGLEIGAGWSKISKNKTPYIDILLDDPTFSQAINCRLFDETEGSAILHWNR